MTDPNAPEPRRGLPPPRARPRWTWKEARHWLQLHAIEKGKTSCDAPFGSDTTVDGGDIDSHWTHPIHIRNRGAIVCTYRQDGTTVLNPGRLRWKSIRDRVNCYTKGTIFQRSGVWFLSQPDGAIPFVDGVAIDSAGMAVGRKAEALEAVEAGVMVCPTCHGDGTVPERLEP